jgi:hypothetical protein
VPHLHANRRGFKRTDESWPTPANVGDPAGYVLDDHSCFEAFIGRHHRTFGRFGLHAQLLMSQGQRGQISVGACGRRGIPRVTPHGVELDSG